jgi:hypothetical protein
MDEFGQPRTGLLALDMRGGGALFSGAARRMALAMEELGRREDDLQG